MGLLGYSMVWQCCCLFHGNLQTAPEKSGQFTASTASTVVEMGNENTVQWSDCRPSRSCSLISVHRVSLSFCCTKKRGKRHLWKVHKIIQVYACRLDRSCAQNDQLSRLPPKHVPVWKHLELEQLDPGLWKEDSPGISTAGSTDEVIQRDFN